MSRLSSDYRHDCLRRKLQLMLGSQKDWLELYGDFCAEHSVSPTQVFEDHNINVFVKQQREARHAVNAH